MFRRLLSASAARLAARVAVPDSQEHRFGATVHALPFKGDEEGLLARHCLAGYPNARRAAPGPDGLGGDGSARWLDATRSNPSPPGPVVEYGADSVRPRAVRVAFLVARACGSQTLLLHPLEGEGEKLGRAEAALLHDLRRC